MASLIVLVRTEFNPGIDFTGVEIAIEKENSDGSFNLAKADRFPAYTTDDYVTVHDSGIFDLLRRRNWETFTHLTKGKRYRINVKLKDANSNIVGEIRLAPLTLRDSRTISIIVPRP